MFSSWNTALALGLRDPDHRLCVTLAGFVVLLANLGSWVTSGLTNLPSLLTATVFSLYEHEKTFNTKELPCGILSDDSDTSVA
jgi:hypothetical protein